MEEMGWIQERSNSEIFTMLGKYCNKDLSATHIFRNIFQNYDEIKSILICKAKDESKDTIVSFVEESSSIEKEEYLIGFKKTVEMLEQRFSD